MCKVYLLTVKLKTSTFSIGDFDSHVLVISLSHLSFTAPLNNINLNFDIQNQTCDVLSPY